MTEKQVTAKEVLTEARDLLEGRWIKGYYFEVRDDSLALGRWRSNSVYAVGDALLGRRFQPEEGQMCAMGAIIAARAKLNGTLATGLAIRSDPAFVAATEALGRRILQSGYMSDEGADAEDIVVEFNDDGSTTEEDVLAQFDAVLEVMA